MTNKKFIVWFWEVDKEDVGLVGGKGANIGEMIRVGLPVPPGFTVTAQAYFHFLEKAKLKPKLKKYLQACDHHDPRSLARTSKVIKKDILDASIPEEISQLIINYYFKLAKVDIYSPKKKELKFLEKIKSSFSSPLVAVRSSATAEDLPEASFAGQQETFLNIKGEANLIQAVKEGWASLFEPRAIFYREEKGFDHLKVGIAILVQKMIQSEASGVTFTTDPVTNDKKTIVIEAIYGLGEYIVQGKVTPDYYRVGKYDLKIKEKKVTRQKIYLKQDSQGKTREMRIGKEFQDKQKISDQQISKLAALGRKIERHYFSPQDIEWGIEKGKIYILQTRPITTIGRKTEDGKRKTEKKAKERQILLEGDGASPGMASGPAVVIKSAKEINKVKKGQVLVAPQTNPDFVPVMKKAVAIVTEKGGRTSHAAIVSRELGIPCVVGAEKATKIIKKGLVVTVDGGEGKIYKGSKLKGSRFEVPARSRSAPALAGRRGSRKERGLKSAITDGERELKFATTKSQLLKTATKVYVNLSQPSRAQEIAKLNVDGVGLLRAEFMIAEIGYHPKKLIKDKKQNLFIDKLASNLGLFCQAFNPRPVVYRTTDFKTTEYRHLKGGKAFEPEEENPMLGFRGAFRYLAQPEVFELELRALKKVRQQMGLKNLWLLLPFVRTTRELKEIKKMTASYGLSRGGSFKIWLMVEIPANVILLDEFIKIGIDGVSIGSNDLTQLILGVDRDNSEVAGLFDERNEAVLWALKKTIKTCQKRKITSSICGQAPSDYSDLVETLVKWGITSVSVNPDAIERTREVVYEAERKLISKK